MTKNIVVLDFDGVVCDGLNECLLSVWNTWHKLGIDAFQMETLQGIPAEFTQRFAQYRNFVRHSGHFVLPFFSDLMAFDSGKEFELAFQDIPANTVDIFLKQFEHYRIEVIEHRYETWIAMHSYYRGMLEVLQNPANDIYIVSGKDQYSIVQILASKGISIDSQKIYGSQKDKIPALNNIARDAGKTAGQICFYDDNLSNMLAAKHAGFNAHWAGWGYKTENDLMISKTENIQLLELDDFVSEYMN